MMQRLTTSRTQTARLSLNNIASLDLNMHQNQNFYASYFSQDVLATLLTISSIILFRFRVITRRSIREPNLTET